MEFETSRGDIPSAENGFHLTIDPFADSLGDSFGEGLDRHELRTNRVVQRKSRSLVLRITGQTDTCHRGCQTASLHKTFLILSCR